MARSGNKQQRLKQEHAELMEKFASYGLSAEEFCRLAILENEITHSGGELRRGLLQLLLNLRTDTLRCLAEIYSRPGPLDVDRLSLVKGLLSESQRLLEKPWLR